MFPINYSKALQSRQKSSNIHIYTHKTQCRKNLCFFKWRNVLLLDPFDASYVLATSTLKCTLFAGYMCSIINEWCLFALLSILRATFNEIFIFPFSLPLILFYKCLKNGRQQFYLVHRT